MKRTGMMFEILLTALFLSLAMAVAVPCLAAAASKSRSAYATDVSIVEVQSLADRISALRGSGCFEGVQGWYDRDMEPCAENGHVYYLCVEDLSADGYLGTAHVAMRDRDGAAVFEVTAAWQNMDREDMVDAE